MLKFPYGLADFYYLQTENYFYVDRTAYIQTIEDFGRELIFLRPRRFGKSLLLSMLENYYDVAKANEFDKLFGHLAIGQNPTPKHNQYFVMQWDFSTVNTQGDLNQIRQALHTHINSRIDNFAKSYEAYLPHPIKIYADNAIASFNTLLTSVNATPYHLYLLIDEYDNFANEFLFQPPSASSSRYQALLSVKNLLKMIKASASGRGLERVFMTGVAPCDMSTSYHTALNIYLRNEFNDLCGFRDSEIQEALTQIAQECNLPTEKVQQALNLIQRFYKGYCFSEQAQELIYNPTLVLYFLKYFQRRGEFPNDMMDDNVAMDRGKLTYISTLPSGESLILQALQDNPPLTLKQLANSFGVEDILKDVTFMVSLLYYFGILTLNGENQRGEKVFRIPNLVILEYYVEKFKKLLLPDFRKQKQSYELAKQFYQSGDLQPLCDFMVQDYFKAFARHDYFNANDLTIKTAFLTVLFNDVLYIMDSEPALEKCYADLTMILRPERHFSLHNFVLKFNYVGLDESSLTSIKAKDLSISEIKELALIHQKFMESQEQLLDYRNRLMNKYEDNFLLQTISVVALGFERIVWEKVSFDT